MKKTSIKFKGVVSSIYHERWEMGDRRLERDYYKNGSIWWIITEDEMTMALPRLVEFYEFERNKWIQNNMRWTTI